MDQSEQIIEEPVTTIQDDVIREARCNCNDEFKTEPCPVHYNTKDKYDKKTVLVTDAHMVPEEIRQWVGYTYVCPKCKEAAILDVMKYCGNCGVEIVLQSRKLTAFIEKLTNSNNQNHIQRR